MRSGDAAAEHFVTLFDRNFLPAGLCLYRSLRQHAGNFRLWVLCMDTATEARLRELALPEVRLLPLAEVETDELRSVKDGRTVGEYCWTITPFTPKFVFDRAPEARRVTYVDADVFFLDDPSRLLDELDAADAQVLITPHAYSPEYDTSAKYGIYCVQFTTFLNSTKGREVLGWWQERCIEWCFARDEDGKFGDQKYLDDWPARFAGHVHVLAHPELALGPWNANRFVHDDAFSPVFFHFHGLRIIARDRIQLYAGYHMTPHARRFYTSYVKALSEAVDQVNRRWGEIPVLALPTGLVARARRMAQRIGGRIAFAECIAGRR